MSRNKVVMFAGSQGGHYKELMGLRPLFTKYHSVLVTDNQNAASQKDVIDDFYDVAYSHAYTDSREKNAGSANLTNRWKNTAAYFKMFLECFKIYKKYKPAIVISTGSYIAVPLFICAKVYGAKTIYIETNALVYGKTMTGKLVERFSDKIYVQWPEMLKVYPKAEYYGVIH